MGVCAQIMVSVLSSDSQCCFCCQPPLPQFKGVDATTPGGRLRRCLSSTCWFISLGLLVLCFGVLELGVAAFPGYLPGPSFPALLVQNQGCFAWDAESRFKSAFPGYSAVHALFIVQTKLHLFHRWSFLGISERPGPAFLSSLSLYSLSWSCFVPVWFCLNVKETQSESSFLWAIFDPCPFHWEFSSCQHSPRTVG